MKKTVFMDKYPIYSLELQKSEMKLTSAKDVATYFREKIENHPIAKFIALFDHYSHTKELNGQIMDGLIDAQNVVFCFGQAIPNTKMLALRPRSIGICEFEDKIIIDFLEAPKEEIHQLMQEWTTGLKNK
ncbi:MAG: hypothetical protein QG617_435 [Campylobacterota bacterium]|nr:hypothetical protein [Campylobacterota bacterium]